MSFVDKDADNGFAEVELDGHSNAGSHFFIESTGWWSFLTTIAMLGAFLVMHTYAALRAPPLLASKEEFFKLNSTESNVSIDVDITLSQLQDLHRFIDVNCSFIRKEVADDVTLPIDVKTSYSSMLNFVTVSEEKQDNRKFDLKFTAGSNRSTAFPVIKLTVKGIDTTTIRMTVQTQYANIEGFQFHWDFNNPSAEKYCSSAKLLMSFLIGYMLVIFAFYLKFDAESFTQIFLLVLGITGVFASNPLNIFLPTSSGAKISDHILMAVFIAVFRMFLMVQLELLRSHNTAPPTVLTIVLGVFFGFYATVDAAAAYDRQALVIASRTPDAVILPTEKALMFIDCLYIILSTGYLVLAAMMNQGANTRRVGYNGFAVCLTNLVTFITHVYFVLENIEMYSVMPQMLFSSIHVSLAAFSIFLLHCGGGPEYRPVDEKNAGDEQAIMIDIERMSGDEDDDDEDDDEDDDDEE